jgi:hypothetical protein
MNGHGVPWIAWFNCWAAAGGCVPLGFSCNFCSAKLLLLAVSLLALPCCVIFCFFFSMCFVVVVLLYTCFVPNFVSWPKHILCLGEMLLIYIIH